MAKSQSPPIVTPEKEDLEDEMLEEDIDDEENDVAGDTSGNAKRGLTEAGLNIGQLMRSGEGDIDLGSAGGKSGNKPSIRKELEKIYNVLTRKRDQFEEAENASGISENIRSNYKKYKELMDDITPNQDGGVYKRVLQPGTGAAGAVGKIVKFHYINCMEDQDEPFDTSLVRERMQKSKLGSGELLAGLEMGLCTMKEGEIADFVIDYNYAYGRMGCPPSIPPECTIRSTVRLVECIDEDPVDAMPIEERRMLPFTEVTAYVERKLEQGKIQFGRGKFNAAINRYKDARMQVEFGTDGLTNQQKTNMKAYLIRLYKNLATCYLKISMPTKVLIYLKKLETMGVMDSKTRFLWAKVHYAQGDYDKALAELRSARITEPGNVDIAKFMAKVQKEKSEYAASEKEQAKRMFAPKNGEGDNAQ